MVIDGVLPIPVTAVFALLWVWFIVHGWLHYKTGYTQDIYRRVRVLFFLPRVAASWCSLSTLLSPPLCSHTHPRTPPSFPSFFLQRDTHTFEFVSHVPVAVVMCLNWYLLLQPVVSRS